MASSRRKRRPISEINVVPYIDVMMELLVFFMITAPRSEEHTSELKSPMYNV